MEKIFEKFDNGTVYGITNEMAADKLSWNAHPTFTGVFLKHLITGEQTNGNLSCHLVKVNPGCCIDTHIHNGKLELHEVVEGYGYCTIGERKLNYIPGTLAVIPADISHKVEAGSNGIYLLAKFSPALL